MPPTVVLCPVGHQVATPTLGAPLCSQQAPVLSFLYVPVITHLSLQQPIRSFSLCVNVTYLYLEADGKASGHARPSVSFTSRGYRDTVIGSFPIIPMCFKDEQGREAKAIVFSRQSLRTQVPACGSGLWVCSLFKGLQFLL